MSLCSSKVYMELIPALSSTVLLGTLSLQEMSEMRLNKAAHVEGIESFFLHRTQSP